MSDLQTLQSEATADAVQYGVPPALFLWQIGQESSWNPNAQNGNATGIAQFMPGTASQFGINPLNPEQSLNAAAQYDAQLYAKSGSWQSALTSYGTLANAPASVMSAFQNVMQTITGTTGANGILSSANSALTGINAGTPAVTNSGVSSTSNSLTSFTSDSIIGRIAFFLLGIVIIAGAIYTYKK